MLDITIGLTEGVAWPWPIAVYLFLAGISGGAVAVAICVNLFRGVHLNTPIMKAATLIGFITIVLGMICLVLDLTNPLFFWRILVYYNPTSVMSIGVMALLFYIPLVFVLMCVALQQEITSVSWLKWLDPIISFFAKFRVALDWIVLILAIAICAYTGFLISALIRFPLINTAVLPALFVASGFSAGCAATKVLAAWLFGADRHGSDLHVLHAAEWPIMAVEALCLLMIIIALVSGNAAAQAAFAAFTTGMWAQVFWVGAVGIGFLIPLALSVYLWIRADTARERARSLAAAVGVGAAVYALGRFMPSEPENIQIDPALMNGLAAGVIGYLFGRSRRGAYIAATVGVLGASVANAIFVWSQGVAQPLTLGGAGAFDVTVISGFLAVLLSELIGEIVERIARGRRRPMREFKNGEFIEREESR